MGASMALPSAAARDVFQAIYVNVQRPAFGPCALSLPARDCCCGYWTTAALTACFASSRFFRFPLGPHSLAESLPSGDVSM